MATPDKKKYLPDLISPSAIMEVVKFNSKTGEFVGLKLMTHGDFKKMERQKGFRYQEYMKGFSQFNK